MEQNIEKINKVEETIQKINNKESNIYFFVIDSKGNPNGEVKYMYDIALNLLEDGYNVTMLHQEDEFIGPNEWLGERYEKLPHKKVGEDNVSMSACDFLFIPEVYSNVISQTKKLPCRRIVLYYNPEYLLEFIPVGVTWGDMGVFDAITTNTTLLNEIKSYFPNVKSRIVRPSVRDCFSTNDAPKKLIVNLLTQTSTEVNHIVKPFYWKYPMYKWVSFRDLKGIPQLELSDVMREGAISVWVDDDTKNAQIALEALKSGSILIAKIPKMVPEWMIENNDLRKDIIWVDSYEMLYDVLSSVIRGWTRDDIISNFTTVHEKLENVFSPSAQKVDITREVVNGIIADTVKSYQQILSSLKNNEKKNNE